jgi:serine/threonine protein kinase
MFKPRSIVNPTKNKKKKKATNENSNSAAATTTDEPELKRKRFESPLLHSTSASTSSSTSAVSCENKSVKRCRSIDCYEPINFIEQGSFGVVFKGKCKETHKIYAIKQVKLDNNNNSSILAANRYGFPNTALREFNILSTLNHPNIVKVREICYGGGSSITLGSKIYMVMEHAGIEITQVMQMLSKSKSQSQSQSHSHSQVQHIEPPFSISEVKQLLGQLLSAVAYMHKHKFIHRDLKTSNLLYQITHTHTNVSSANTNDLIIGGKLTVCDYGLARRYHEPSIPMTNPIATLRYRCPQLLIDNNNNNNNNNGCLQLKRYEPSVDTWSIGCIFAEFLLGKQLFDGTSELSQLHSIFSLLGVGAGVGAGVGVDVLAAYTTGIATSTNSSASSCSTNDTNDTNGSSTVDTVNELNGIKSKFSGRDGSLCLSENGCQLLANMLRIDSSKRITPRSALDSDFMAIDLPKPVKQILMPKIYENENDKGKGKGKGTFTLSLH